MLYKFKHNINTGDEFEIEKETIAQNNAGERHSHNLQDSNDIKSLANSKSVSKIAPSTNDEESTQNSIIEKSSVVENLTSTAKTSHRLSKASITYYNKYFKTVMRMKYAKKLRQQLLALQIILHNHLLAINLKETIRMETKILKKMKSKNKKTNKK